MVLPAAEPLTYARTVAADNDWWSSTIPAWSMREHAAWETQREVVLVQEVSYLEVTTIHSESDHLHVVSMHFHGTVEKAVASRATRFAAIAKPLIASNIKAVWWSDSKCNVVSSNIRRFGTRTPSCRVLPTACSRILHAKLLELHSSLPAATIHDSGFIGRRTGADSAGITFGPEGCGQRSLSPWRAAAEDPTTSIKAYAGEQPTRPASVIAQLRNSAASRGEMTPVNRRPKNLQRTAINRMKLLFAVWAEVLHQTAIYGGPQLWKRRGHGARTRGRYAFQIEPAAPAAPREHGESNGPFFPTSRRMAIFLRVGRVFSLTRRRVIFHSSSPGLRQNSADRVTSFLLVVGASCLFRVS